ncbi:JAB domain-containing protein [Neisseria sp. Ec49-e6-T10]|uniref:JAB domain-containing protein n=1 Tax=Neisseria sp. Ec49-e6-T10 TaxID=3140744 RepID=UPI003EBB5692
MNIKLTDQDKIQIQDSDDIYGIMQRILLRENKFDQEKEHFWIIGLNQASYILYIELVSLGSTKATIVEPMNVFRVAILKNATRVIAVHNHPAGTMKPSEEDKEITDRLIQVGRIIDIKVEDHLIISTTNYMSFKEVGLMDELEKSIKYVPSYQLAEQIRKEEKAVAKEALKNAQDAHEQEKEKILTSAISFLIEKELKPAQIAKILGLSTQKVSSIIRKMKDN